MAICMLRRQYLYLYGDHDIFGAGCCGYEHIDSGKDARPEQYPDGEQSVFVGIRLTVLPQRIERVVRSGNDLCDS
jgi:hypothetical protein